MKYLNEEFAQLKPSATLAVKARATELKKAGKKILDLSTGEPDADTPEHIKQAAEAALAQGKTKYTADTGIVELREAIAQKLTRENGLAASANQIIVCNGGKQALHELFCVTLNPGDEVIIPAPFWVSYPTLVKIGRGTPVIVSATRENGFKLTPEQLEAALTPKTRIVLINSPSNPTGAAYTEAEQKALGEVLRRHTCLILSDEVYEKITYDNFRFVSFAKACPDLADRVLTVNSFSKTYSMTGWRVGYAHAPAEVVKAMGNYQGQTTSNVSSPAQYAALAALSGPHDFLKGFITSFERRYRVTIEGLGGIPGVIAGPKPPGAFYLFVGTPGFVGAGKPFKDCFELATYLLEEVGVAIVPGAPFGDPTAFRMSVAAADADLEEGVDKIRTALLKRK